MLVGGDDKLFPEHANWHNPQCPCRFCRNMLQSLGINPHGIQIDLSRTRVKLGAGCFPDVFRATQAQRQRDIAKPLSGGRLFAEDLLNIVRAEGHEVG
jgi:hypothetical protein